jgi:hypothetical protein
MILLQSLLEKAGPRAWTETTTIGDVFLQVTAFLKSYTDYVNNYSHALETLNKSRRESSKF